MSVPQTRQQAIHHARRQLLRHGWPRLQMLLLVAMTGGAGFLASWGLRHAGMAEMWLRYPLAVGIAYLVFLLLLSLWLHTRSDDWLDATDLLDVGPQGVRGGWQGHGGHSGGGGASASFESPGADADITGGALDAVTGPVGDAMGAVGDADEFAIPLAALVGAIAVVAVLAMSSLFVVWSAPVLLAELAVDFTLAAGLYRRLRHLPTRHWLQSALRRTWFPFVLTGLFAALAGAGMAWYVPGADSIGDVIAARHAAH